MERGVVETLNYLAIGFTLFSALAWIASASIKVRSHIFSIRKGLDNLTESVRVQSLWNSWAAFFAGLAALCQVIAWAWIHNSDPAPLLHFGPYMY